MSQDTLDYLRPKYFGSLGKADSSKALGTSKYAHFGLEMHMQTTIEAHGMPPHNDDKISLTPEVRVCSVAHSNIFGSSSLVYFNNVSRCSF